jgi:hypothetical protein
MVLIVADFFLVEPRGNWFGREKGHRATCSHVWLRQIMYTARMPDHPATDRPEIGQSIATVLIASSEVHVLVQPLNLD